MNNDSNNPVSKIAKELIKKKTLAILASVFVSLLPFLLGFIVTMIFASLILLPLAGLFGDDIDFFNEKSGGMTKEEQAFKEKLDERITYWNDRSVEVDPSLALAIILYEAEFGYDEECDPTETEDCFSDTRNYKKLIKEIPEVIDNMVESVEIYSCKSEIIEKETICEKDTEGNLVDPSTCEVVTKEPTYGEKKVCGKDLASCSNMCVGEFLTEKETVYQIKTEEDYIKWLKEEFLPDKLKSLDIDIPVDSIAKEELFNQVTIEMISARSTVNEDSSLIQFLGNNLRSFGTAGPIDPDVLAQLVSPMGSQNCKQTACFGVYGINNPVRHNGVDIGNNGGNPKLYSIYSGKVVSITKGSGNCKPNFDASPICGTNCVATIILIEHDVMANGITHKLYSRYVHLNSIAPGITVGSDIAIGQEIGVMGNTGCSSAAHLHFEMWNSERKRHNPEELLVKTACVTISNCEKARELHL